MELQFNQLNNLEAEQVILGTIIQNNKKLLRIEDIIEAKHFFYKENYLIFTKIVDYIKQDIVADYITLKQFFLEKEDLSLDYLEFIIGKAVIIVDIRGYAIQVKELWQKRELIDIAKKIELDINLPTNIIVNNINNVIKNIDSNCGAIQVFDGEDAINEWESEYKKELSKPIPTGLSSLDEMLNGGLHKEGLYVLGAGSGTGKTFLSQNIMLQALRLEYGVFFASMEMSKRKIVARFLSILAKINSFRILVNNIFLVENEKFSDALSVWKKFQKNFFIVEKMSMSPDDIEFALKQSLKKSPIGLIVIDYAQIMKLREAKNINEASLIKENVNAIAKIAQKYKVAILLLSQLTKDKISGKVGLGSLKGSGGLYEDADCVIAMWSETEERERVKTLQMEVLKNRDGMSSGFSIKFNGEFGEFFEKNENIF